MTASTSRGSYWSWVKASCPVLGSKPVSSSRWMVEASVEHSSPRRLAARPVGAARAVSSPMASNRASTPRRQVVLPVPGPAGEEHHLPGGGHLHRLALLGGRR